MIAHDIYSETNPAFCAMPAIAFTSAYVSENSNGVELSLLYIALPIVLSGDFINCFHGSNKKTGLREWMSRNPEIRVGLASRLNATMGIVTEAIRLSCFAQILSFNQEACLVTGSKFKKGFLNVKMNDETKQIVKCAERLGAWFANAGSAKEVFNIMQLTL